jgi:hypothetical protein
MLGKYPKPVMAVWGSGGMGKSSLMAWMIHECSFQKLRKVEVIYTDDSVYDYIAIMRKCRDDLGTEHFLSFTDLINYYTVPEYKLKLDLGNANIKVAEGMQANDEAEVQQVAGVIVNIKDAMFSSPRNDLDVSELERRRKLTEGFLKNLEQVSASGVIVIFIDGTERMSELTQRWLWESVIRAITEKPLPNVRIVILGRSKPEIDRYRKPFVTISELTPLSKKDIIELLEKRGLPAEERETMAKTLMASHKGHPLQINTTIDELLLEEDEPQ